MPHKEKSGKSDLVTEADFAAQEKITEELARLYPDTPVIGEEGQQREQRKPVSFGRSFEWNVEFLSWNPLFQCFHGSDGRKKTYRGCGSRPRSQLDFLCC